jgi:branched-subunit amino acid aminotransferase/4-amino-4-deoxychorismate lyase
MSLPILVSRNGVLIQPAQACVTVFNPAIYGAYGVYESVEVTHGTSFALAAHLQRLAHSAILLEMALPVDMPTMERWIAEVLAANDVAECTLRLFVIGAEEGEEATVYVWPQAPIRYPINHYTHGVPAITFPGQRFMPEAKSINTLASYLARRKAQSAGAHEALLVHDGYLTEGANSNVFAVASSVVMTPPPHQVLAGVTRDILSNLARRHGLEVREVSLLASELGSWTECFITSTSRHVMPITKVDGKPIGGGGVGPVTSQLMTLYEEYFVQATASR